MDGGIDGTGVMVGGAGVMVGTSLVASKVEVGSGNGIGLADDFSGAGLEGNCVIVADAVVVGGAAFGVAGVSWQESAMPTDKRTMPIMLARTLLSATIGGLLARDDFI